jgi:hypothetical protein
VLCLLLANVGEAATPNAPTKNINMLLMEQIERDADQWPAIVAWANQLIATNHLLPAGYYLK